MQNIFNKVIEAGLYNEKDGLMCHSLYEAAYKGVVTTYERDIALKAIQVYLSGFGSLGGFLDHQKSAFDFPARLSIYQNWESRPFNKESK